MFFESKTMFFYQKKWKYVLSFFSHFLIDVLGKWCQRSHALVCKKWSSRYQTLIGFCTLLKHMHTSEIYLSLKDITRIDVFSVCGPMGGKWGWICTDLALPLLTGARTCSGRRPGRRGAARRRAQPAPRPPPAARPPVRRLLLIVNAFTAGVNALILLGLWRSTTL